MSDKCMTNSNGNKTKARYNDLLIRIDERTLYMKEIMDKMVTKEEFNPVKRVVYGLVAVLLTGTLVAIIAVAIPSLS